VKSPSGRRPPRTMGTAGAKTTTEEGRTTDATSTHRQTDAKSFKMVLGRLQSHQRQLALSPFLPSRQRSNCQWNHRLTALQSNIEVSKPRRASRSP